MTTSIFPAVIGDVMAWDSKFCAVMLVVDPEAIEQAKRHRGGRARVTIEYVDPAQIAQQMDLTKGEP